MKLTLKQGDTRHAIRATLKTVEGETIDLTDATIQFKMSNRYKNVEIDRQATSTADGSVQFVFVKGETDTPGYYDAEFQVTYADSRIETFPHTGNIKIVIESRIGGI